MSIRELSFDEGQSLNIRECPKLPPNQTTLNALKDYETRKDILIVKSGRSYHDVTSKPDIFNQARPFDLGSLTAIEQKELQQKEVTPAFSEDKDADPMAVLFKNTAQEEDEEEYEEYERKTYYLRLDHIESLRRLGFVEQRDVSDLVRELLDIGIASKSVEHNTDFRKEAEEHVLTQPRKPKKRKKKRART